MNEALDYPRPYEDEDNAEFIAAWRNEGRIVLQQAAEGGRPFFYPRPMCPYTGSANLISIPASGKGRIVSYALVHRPNHPAFNEEVPIVLAEIALAEGASLLGRIICEDSGKVASGLAVDVLPLEEAKRYPLPAFSLVETADA